MVIEEQERGDVDPDLQRLQDEHKDLWNIRRRGALWVATRRTDDGVEPTIIEDSPDRLRTRLEAPGTWAQRAPRQRGLL